MRILLALVLVFFCVCGLTSCIIAGPTTHSGQKSVSKIPRHIHSRIRALKLKRANLKRDKLELSETLSKLREKLSTLVTKSILHQEQATSSSSRREHLLAAKIQRLRKRIQRLHDAILKLTAKIRLAISKSKSHQRRLRSRASNAVKSQTPRKTGTTSKRVVLKLKPKPRATTKPKSKPKPFHFTINMKIRTTNNEKTQPKNKPPKKSTTTRKTSKKKVRQPANNQPAPPTSSVATPQLPSPSHQSQPHTGVVPTSPIAAEKQSDSERIKRLIKGYKTQSDKARDSLMQHYATLAQLKAQGVNDDLKVESEANAIESLKQTQQQAIERLSLLNTFKSTLENKKKLGKVQLNTIRRFELSLHQHQ